MVAALLLVCQPCAARADTIVYQIEEIGTFAGYTELNVGQTYPGTGFVGLYETAENGSDEFAHLFGVEATDYSRTALEVGIAALGGATINSAILSFDLLDGETGAHDIVLTSFSATGALGWFWDPPDDLGTQYETVQGYSSNAMDVTGLLQARVDVDADWFGLHLQGDDDTYQWTYTYAGWGFGPDSANVRLTVDYTPGGAAAIPEPASLSLLGLGALALLRRRRRA